MKLGILKGRGGVLLAWLAAAPALGAAPASSKTAEAGTSTAAVRAPEAEASTAPAPGASSIYTAERLRDPFQRVTASGGGIAGRTFAPEDFNIHNMTLRGIMRDAGSDYALLTDNTFSVSFMLRKGRLHDSKGKPVPGVSGSINIRQKTVHLMTQDKDVQVFRLGEESSD